MYILKVDESRPFCKDQVKFKTVAADIRAQEKADINEYHKVLDYLLSICDDAYQTGIVAKQADGETKTSDIFDNNGNILLKPEVGAALNHLYERLYGATDNDIKNLYMIIRFLLEQYFTVNPEDNKDLNKLDKILGNPIDSYNKYLILARDGNRIIIGRQVSKGKTSAQFNYIFYIRDVSDDLIPFYYPSSLKIIGIVFISSDTAKYDQVLIAFNPVGNGNACKELGLNNLYDGFKAKGKGMEVGFTSVSNYVIDDNPVERKDNRLRHIATELDDIFLEQYLITTNNASFSCRLEY